MNSIFEIHPFLLSNNVTAGASGYESRAGSIRAAFRRPKAVAFCKDQGRTETAMEPKGKRTRKEGIGFCNKTNASKG